MFRLRSWQHINAQTNALYTPSDRIQGPQNCNAQTNVRIFSTTDAAKLQEYASGRLQPRVTLYRDWHAWCPYCQKIWLFLEENRIDYSVRKVTMFCYGNKERWYKQIVPSGMLPAVAIDGQIVTESDVVLGALESEFGPLAGRSMKDSEVVKNRNLERQLFRAWCNWLCYPSNSIQQEKAAKENFHTVCKQVEKRISESPGPYLLEDFGISDTILAPYIERMASSLYYYKGYNLRANFRVLNDWFGAMETRESYRGCKSDHHTHVHDLPPQMGGCYFGERSAELVNCGKLVNQPLTDSYPPLEIDEAAFPEPANSRVEAVYRILKHKESLARASPIQDAEVVDLGLRATCSWLLDRHFEAVKGAPSEGGIDDARDIDKLSEGSSLALRYIRDRLCVPRDMSFWAGRRLRQAIQHVCDEVGTEGDLREYTKNRRQWGIPVDHRRDQDPTLFVGRV